MIKILFVGEGLHPMYEKAFYNAAGKIDGVEPYLFDWEDEVRVLRKTIIGKLEYKFSIGGKISKINKRLVQYCEKNRFDIVFMYSCRLITKETTVTIAQCTDYLITYNNDNPFSEYYPAYFWRNWINSAKCADMVYVYRNENIEDCKKIGIEHVKQLRSYYNPDRIYYIPDKDIDLKVPEVVFIGHYEDDKRKECIAHLSDNGVRVGVPKIEGWTDIKKHYENVILIDDTHANYNEIINKAKICLVFLSEINHDTYTRRCFEIPVVKSLMISEYTDDIASMFKENKEIVFFRNKEELKDKILYYLRNDDERNQIAEAGYRRVIRDNHRDIDRLRTVIEDYKAFGGLNR